MPCHAGCFPQAAESEVKLAGAVLFLYGGMIGCALGENALLYSPIDFKNPPGTFVRVAEDLRAVSFVQADFKEERRLPYLKESIHSQGIVVYAPQIGLQREITEPVREQWLITSQEASLITQEKDGSLKTLTQSAEFQVIAKSILAIFSGDLSDWNKQFHVFYREEQSSQWTLRFKPRKNNPLARFARTFELSGTLGQIRWMLWEGKEGDKTETRFQNIDLRRGLSENEVRLLFSKNH